MTTTRVRGVMVVVVALALALVLSPAARAQQFRFGLVDSLYADDDAAVRSLWFDRTKEAGAQLVRPSATWRAIAPVNRPAGFDPTNPADPAYRWSRTDNVVREASARGLTVVLAVTSAPAWAEGPHRPSVDAAPAGTWRPDARAYGDFARALATRYSGTFPDPLDPSGTLPRVQYYEAWNEPNLVPFLNPQWKGKKPQSPGIYRRMLNSLYRGVKAVDRGNRVIAPALSPYGDPPAKNLNRMRPLQFLREFFCLRGRRALRPKRCPKRERPRFDILGHHAINPFEPRRHAIHPDDVSSFDLGRIKPVLRKARKTGRALPKGKKPLWVTESWWRSKPPDPFGQPPAKHAQWLEEGMYLYWKQGARAAIWFRIRDPEPGFEDFGDVATGLYFSDGTAKPALQAYRFPFVTDRRRGGKRVQAWGRAPERAQVAIQQQQGSDWRTVKRATPGRDGVFATRIRARGGDRLRALLPSGETSLTWTQR